MTFKTRTSRATWESRQANRDLLIMYIILREIDLNSFGSKSSPGPVFKINSEAIPRYRV